MFRPLVDRPAAAAPLAVRRMPPAGGPLSFALIALFSAAPLFFGAIDPWGQSLLTAGVFASAAVWIVASRGAVPWPSLGAWAAGGLALLAFLQSRAAGVPWEMGPALRTVSRQGSLDAARLWAAWAVLLWMGGSIFHAPIRRRAAAYGVLMAAVVFAALGIVLHGQSAPAVFGRSIARAGQFFATYVNRNQAAAFMAMGLTLGAGLWLARLKAFRDWASFGERANFWSVQILLFGAFGLMALGLWLTGSRGALHAWSLSSFIVLCVAFLSPPRWTRGFFVLAALAGLYAAMVSSFPETLGLSAEGWDGPARERLAIWEASLALFRDHQGTGAGVGAFNDAFAAYQPSGLRGRVEHAHSEWLEIFCGGGIVGGALFTAATLVPWALGLWRWRREADPAARCVNAGLLAAAGGFLFHGLVDFPLQIPANAGLFFLALSCLGRRPSADAVTTPKVFPFLLLAPLAGLLFFAVKPALAWAHVRRAGAISLTEKAVLMETALRWEPANAGYRRRLGAVYLGLARQTPSARRLFSRQALAQADACLAAAPADAGCLDLAADSLQALGRAADADGRRAEARRLRPWAGARP